MRSEAERQFYLGRAGIHLWYARSPLPGAAPSPEFSFPDEVDTPAPAPLPTPPPSRSGKGDAGKRRIAGIQALMKGDDKEAPTAVEPPKALAQPAPVAEIVPEESSLPTPSREPEPESRGLVSAYLGFWMAREMVLVSSMSDQASDRLQDALAKNILAAVGGSEVNEMFHIRWPVFGNPRVPGNGASDFQTLLRSVSSDFGSRKLLLLGVLTDDFPSERSDWLAASLGAPALDFPRSLAELAAVPAFKRELWQQLKSSVRG